MNVPYLIDSHCHLDFDYEDKSPADLVNQAMENGVKKFITINTEIKRIEGVQKISEEFENVFHTIGVHPHDVSDIEPGDLEKIKVAAQHPKCKAIGEIGLDYYYKNSPIEIQKKQLIEQLNIAIELSLPVVIHARDAEGDLLNILTPYAKKITNRSPGVIHCFSASQAFGKSCVDLGFYLSFSGILTFKKAADLRKTAQDVPINKILVETDSPFLAPVPYRGKKCEPFMVKNTAKILAQIRGQSLEEITIATTRNAEALFGI